MQKWISKIARGLRSAVAALLLVGLGVFLYFALGPVPRWSKAGKVNISALHQHGDRLVLQWGGWRSPENALSVVSAGTGETLFATPISGAWGNHAESTDGRYIVAEVDSKALRFFDFQSGRELTAQVPAHSDYWAISLFPQPNYCVVRHYPLVLPANYYPKPWEERVSVVNAATGEVVLASEAPRCFFRATADEHLIFNCEGQPGEPLLEIWKMSSSPEVRRFPGFAAEELSEDGRSLLVSNAWEERNLLEVSSGKLKPQLVDAALEWHETMRRSRNRWRLVIRSNNPSAKPEIDASKLPTPLKEFAGHDLSPCGRRLLTGEHLSGNKGSDCSIVKLWHLATGEILFSDKSDLEYQTHRFTATDLLLYRENNDGSRAVKMVNLETGELSAEGTRFYHAKELLAIPTAVKNPIRVMLAKLGIGQAPTMTHWQIINVEDRAPLFEFSTVDKLTDLAITKDQRTLFTVEDVAGADQVVKAWDLPERRPWGWIVGLPLALAALWRGTRWWWRRWKKRSRSPTREPMAVACS